MISKSLSVFLSTVFILFFGMQGFSSSGGLDANSGHTSRKTGEYHTHSKSLPDSDAHPERSYRAPVLQTENSQTKIKDVTVVGVMDGDTIKVIINGQEKRIRLYGIDTPEKSQAYGQKATDAIKKILTGRDVKIEIMDVDRYGRTVAMVYADGKSVNEMMVKGGHAWVYPKYCKVQVCSDWQGSEDEARSLKKALWKDSSPEQPWNWRKQQKDGRVNGI